MSTYQFVASFLESEMEEIIFTYRVKEDTLEFSDYSCSMMNLPKIVENPFSNEIILSRLKSESIDSIIHKMDLTSPLKQEIEILFMSKPFLLRYQCLIDEGCKAVVCILKEKREVYY